MMGKTSIAFLTGAGGSAEFWHPVGNLLRPERKQTFHSWPGLGNEPASPLVKSVDDLADLVTATLCEPTDLVTQSMGGVIAMRLALATPALVRRLVLTGTSGGISLAGHGAEDWRASYRQEFPAAPGWLYSDWGDVTASLGRIDHPVLLLWGDCDPISPVSVGQKLQALLSNAELHVLKGGGHDLARTHARAVAGLIERFLG